jgi:predicted transcriptional regulator
MTDLKANRVAVKFSQSELARRSGVPRVKICLFELGDGKLTTDEQGRIRVALESEVDRLRNVSIHVEFSASTAAAAGAIRD